MTQTIKTRLALVTALLAAAWAAWQAPRPPAPSFHSPLTTTSEGSALPHFQSSLLPTAAPSAHASSLAQLQDGTLLIAWFAGSREGAKDVAIYLSRREAGGWSPPQVIASRLETARELRRHLRKLGNPVLHVDTQGRLHLFFVSVSLGGWAGGSINHKFSDDGGQHWSPAKKLITTPFLNISTLVRNPPLMLQDGGLGLPAYHEFVTKHGEWLRLDATGQLVDKVRMPHRRETLQPTVAALDEQHALALLRDAGPGPGHVQLATSQDAGMSWQMAAPLPIPHSNASMALLRLNDGRLLMAGNPGSGRASLLLYLSRDQGLNWQALGPVETGPEQDGREPEFSYPSLIQAKNGDIHLSYTWQRQGIRHATFSPSWLTAREQSDGTRPVIPATEVQP